MTASERQATFGLAAVYGARMLGLFLILPVFALVGEDLAGATPLLIGLAIGVYGLTQAMLQIPFGLLSDRLGRKPMIFTGLLLFAVGSVIAAVADDIWWVIIGRAIQGAGAVSAAVMALAADLTREEQRTKAMAIIGVTIGASFLLAMLLGPILAAWAGLPGVFWFTALMACTGIALVALIVPSPARSRVHRDAEPVPEMFRRVLVNPELLRLDFGIFTLHLVMTSLFLVVPLTLRDFGLAPASHGLFYLPVMLASVAAMVPLIIVAERYRRAKQVFLGAILVMVGVLVGLGYAVDHFWVFVASLVLFFTAINLLEALLPSLVSKTAPVEAKGTAMGFYSSSQFLGAFCGGLIGGWVFEQFGQLAIFAAGAIAATLWLLVAAGMSQPKRYASRLVSLDGIGGGEPGVLLARLRDVPGVVEAVVIADEGVAYLKVDRDRLDNRALDEIVARPA
jgi:MFS family permease